LKNSEATAQPVGFPRNDYGGDSNSPIPKASLRLHNAESLGSNEPNIVRASAPSFFATTAATTVRLQKERSKLPTTTFWPELCPNEEVQGGGEVVV